MEFTFFWTVSFRGSYLLCLGCAWWTFTNWWDWVSHTSTTYSFMRMACPHVCMIHRSCCSVLIEAHKFLCFRSNQRLPCKFLARGCSPERAATLWIRSQVSQKFIQRSSVGNCDPRPGSWLSKSQRQGFQQTTLRNSTVKSQITSVLCMTARNVDITCTHYYLNCIEPPDL